MNETFVQLTVFGSDTGAMLSHDNITWTCHLSMEHYGWNRDGSEQLMSYLPLSHVAAQLIDCYMAMSIGANVLFADKNALKGTLVRGISQFT